MHNIEDGAGRMRRGGLSAVGLAVLSLLVITSLAMAAHFHSYNRPHGLVHGSSTTDGSFFGDTDARYINDFNYCYVGDLDIGVNYGDVTDGGENCRVWTWAYYVAIDECRGASYHAVTGPNPLGGHPHYDHNPGGTCKKYHQ